MLDKELTPKQYGAIRRSIILGRTLQNNHPEIADFYRSGYTLNQIVNNLNIKNIYGVSDSIAWSGVRNAIAGNNGFLTMNIDGYEGLINDEERERLGMEHMLEGAILAGQKTHEERKGIHSLSSEEREKIGRKAYKTSLAKRSSEQRSEDAYKGGKKTYEQKKGIHAQTMEQRKELGRKLYEEKKGFHGRTAEKMTLDGHKGAISQGKTPYTDEEIEYAYKLSLEPAYQHPESSYYAGKPNNRLIAVELNKMFHDSDEIRNRTSVNCLLHRIRKTLENKVNTNI